jgi:sulfotransferase family protein
VAAGLTEVLYVLGCQHSGSTLLGNLLGERPGHVSAGELRAAWREWLVPDARCGCGELLRACSFWREVGIEQAAGAMGVQALAALDARLAATRRLPALSTGRLESHARPLRVALARLQARVAAAAGADVVVDTSKVPSAAILLGAAPKITLRVVHLVRDSRGVLASYRRRGSQGFPARTLMSLWSVWNVHAERHYGAAARLRYEDLADGRVVELGTHHTVFGNRGRFRTGPARLDEDLRWRSELEGRDRALALALTGPLLARYGYLPRRASSSSSWVLDTI